MDSITLHSAFEPSAIQFGPLSKTSKGGKIVYLNFPHKQRIRVQTPIMSAPFGISTFDDPSGGQQSFSLDASFRGTEKTGFLEKCRALDTLVLETAASRSKEWFGKAQSVDVVGELMRKIVRDPNDPKYAPTMRLKITPTTDFYNETEEQVDMAYIVKGTSFRAIVELSSVWFVGKSFGVTWRVVQLAVVSRPEQLTSYAFQVDEEDVEKENME